MRFGQKTDSHFFAIKKYTCELEQVYPPTHTPNRKKYYRKMQLNHENRGTSQNKKLENKAF